MKKLISFIATILQIAIVCPVRAQVSPDTASNSEGLESTPASSSLIVRLANESNKPDGIFGPVTYGLLGSYEFSPGYTLKGTFVRLHEPGMSMFQSYLDEARLGVALPEIKTGTESLGIEALLWRNRTVDMYTTVAGVDLSQSLGSFSLLAGLYAGFADRAEARARFLGAQGGISTALGPLELGLTYLAGAMKTSQSISAFGDGRYYKAALESALDLDKIAKLPLSVTFDVERRYFKFGDEGPAIDPDDTWIYVLGLELNVLDLVSSH